MTEVSTETLEHCARVLRPGTANTNKAWEQIIVGDRRARGYQPQLDCDLTDSAEEDVASALDKNRMSNCHGRKQGSQERILFSFR